MNDKPRTMMLGPHEWQTLVMTGATNLYNQAQRAVGVPNAEDIKWLHDQLDRLKMQVSAWGASGQQPHVPEGSVMRQAGAELQEGELVAENGTGMVIPVQPKKKRGWQKGRKRGPRKPKQGEAVQ